jgi:hypothetical protein
MVIGGLVVAAQIWSIAGSIAGPWEDGMVAYNRGDYMPATGCFARSPNGATPGRSI